MRWPWSRSVSDCGGAEAREEATAHLRKAQERWPEVNRVSKSLRDLRERNHFGESVIRLFSERQG